MISPFPPPTSPPLGPHSSGGGGGPRGAVRAPQAYRRAAPGPTAGTVALRRRRPKPLGGKPRALCAFAPLRTWDDCVQSTNTRYRMYMYIHIHMLPKRHRERTFTCFRADAFSQLEGSTLTF